MIVGAVVTILLSVVSIGFAVASLLMSTYSRWIYREEIPATLAGRPVPPMPTTARVGAWLAGVRR